MVVVVWGVQAAFVCAAAYAVPGIFSAAVLVTMARPLIFAAPPPECVWYTAPSVLEWNDPDEPMCVVYDHLCDYDSDASDGGLWF